MAYYTLKTIAKTNDYMAVSENYDFGTLPERKDFISSVAKKGNSFILVLDLNKILESIENEIDSKH